MDDQEWLKERLVRALARESLLEVSVEAAAPGSDRWNAASFVLRHAMDEIRAYTELLATVVDGQIPSAGSAPR